MTLGRITNNEMVLSDYGEIIHTEWLTSFEIRNDIELQRIRQYIKKQSN